ncbi:glucose-6-phosphate dehydrogenase [Aureococcus anophagefferens]|uniref:glucose-6-phosphate dehydrogenase (NADP(+)) n=1 Tax=Aureococcus anophagefferens TaxID=44056 RepID=A0ABR1FL87_AURAN
MKLGAEDVMLGTIKKKQAELDAAKLAEEEAKRSKAEPFPSEMRLWSVADAARWLDTLSLGQYKAAFREASVDGDFLLELREEDLIQVLGMEHKLHAAEGDPRRDKLKPLSEGDVVKKALVLREEAAAAERDGVAIPSTDVVFSQCRNARAKRLEESLNMGFPIDKEDEKGNTLLSLASQNLNQKICEMLLARNADINHRNAQGNTPLHFAMAYDSEGTLAAYHPAGRRRHHRERPAGCRPTTASGSKIEPMLSPPPPPAASPGGTSLAKTLTPAANRLRGLNLGGDAAKRPISVVIFGATGDLAKKKLYPALYQLMLLGQLPRKDINCANVKRDPRLPFADFEARLSFVGGGGYDKAAGFEKLAARTSRPSRARRACDRLFFLSVPPTTSGCFDESELFRIDHYLGKEVVLNLFSLRFANQLFEPTWNAESVESNHLLQVFVLCAMEPPASKAPADVQAAKVALLEKVAVLDVRDASSASSRRTLFFEEAGYLDDPGVPDDSVTPTFAAVVLRVDNDRWRGVPFLMKAGKGLDERRAEVRVRYKAQPYNALLVDSKSARNELVCRIQPDEALYLKTHTKKPGLTHECAPACMDMRYSSEFERAYLADAYERMFLNAAKGDSSLFVSAPELVEAWRIFTPLLHAIDGRAAAARALPLRRANPAGFREWSLDKAGVKQRPSFMEHLATLAGDAEVRDLARDLYDGRDCPDKSLRKFLQVARGFELKERITFKDFCYFARCAKAAFGAKPRSYQPPALLEARIDDDEARWLKPPAPSGNVGSASRNEQFAPVHGAALAAAVRENDAGVVARRARPPRRGAVATVDGAVEDERGWYVALEEVTHGFRVDILINNAGYNPYLEANCLNTNAFDVHRRFVDAMLTAYLRLCHACLPHMIDNEYGRASPLARARATSPPAPRAGVVNVASVASHLTSSMESKFNMYGAVKGAVAAFSTALRRNLLEGSVGKACGVHVTAACPGSVPTALARDAPRSALAEAHAAVTPDALKWGLASTPEWTAEAAWRAVSANRPYAFNSRMDKLIAVVMHLFTLLHVLFYS